ncbi:hypothetical protein [Variovorax terrae]|uniref:Uncharacterized protein n=1 Tax=Variovorax terrae TaxID=2923278 RepID=A0A9X1VWC9_9BURK|nr:hypothetical protein [Variovorax terrae]MCJ0763274.1 hypothetical protein [Variovorax terrae]
MSDIVWKSGWFVAHAWIADQAEYFLESAEDASRPEGLKSNAAAALVFGGFCLEAFANSAGRVWIPHWDFLERKLSPKEKCQLIGTALGLQTDFGKAPFQCVPMLFEFRNWLAHGKDERVREEIKVDAERAVYVHWGAPQHKQQMLLEPSLVRKHLTQADELIELIEKKSRRRKRDIPMHTTWMVGTKNKAKKR